MKVLPVLLLIVFTLIPINLTYAQMGTGFQTMGLLGTFHINIVHSSELSDDRVHDCYTTYSLNSDESSQGLGMYQITTNDGLTLTFQQTSAYILNLIQKKGAQILQESIITSYFEAKFYDQNGFYFITVEERSSFTEEMPMCKI